MTLPVNPYLYRTAIKDDRGFFGRQQELTFLFERVGADQPQSVSVVGERRVGKSSLLRAILRGRASHLRRPDEYVFVFLDLQERMHADVPQFFAALLEEIAVASQSHALADQLPTYENIRKVVAGFDRNRVKLVVLLDEFEVVTQNRNFTIEFFSFLRSLPNNYGVSYVVTSVRELQELCHSKEIAGSPFFNIFHKLNLSSFPPEEALELVVRPSRAAGYPLESYAPFVFRMAGHFPFFLQQACSAFFEVHREHPDEKTPNLTLIWQRFYDEARDHFEYIWDQLSERERTLLLKVSAHAELTEADRRRLGTLGRRGYIHGNATEARLFSDVFEAFVQAKAAAEPLPTAGVGRDSPPAESAEQLLADRRRIDEQLRQKFLRHLAILYVDLVGSTQFSENQGPFAAFNLVKRLEEFARPLIARHRGEMIKLVGDAVLARFDQASDAVAAGIALQKELGRANASVSTREHIRVKVAINYGEAIVVEGDVYGDAINTAERVLREATADQVLISEFVHSHLEVDQASQFAEKGAFSLKGKAQPVRLFSCQPAAQ